MLPGMRSIPASMLVLASACGQAAPPATSESSDGGGILSLDGSGGDATGTPAVGDTGQRFDVGVVMTAESGPTDSSGDECDGLVATIRDFQSSHPDFETYSGNDASVGLVMPMLGPDSKPVFNPGYAGTQMITSADTFAQWYVDLPGVNMPFPIDLGLMENTPGMFVFDSSAFFPIDGEGFGNEGNDHNFHFTTEVHTSFTYAGGEVFTFRGDDDLWMFVDGRLAIDLGGLHPALEASVEMDTLGLTIGETYPMDIFHAERHTNESNFRIVTTISCFVTPPPPG